MSEELNLEDFEKRKPLLVLADLFDVDNDIECACLFFPRCRRQLFETEDGERKYVPKNRIMSCKYCPLKGKMNVKYERRLRTDFDPVNETYTINIPALKEKP